MNWLKEIQNLGITPLSGDSFFPLEESEILDIEHKLGGELPKEYRLFLKTYGDSNFEEFVKYPTKGGGIYPGFFYGKNLLATISQNEDRLPNLVIPINNDGGNNLLCISLRKKDFGSIYFHNHSIGWDINDDNVNEAKEKTLYLVAKDFPSFILGLEIE